VHKTQYFLTYFIHIWSPIESLAEIGPSYGAKGHGVVGIQLYTMVPCALA